MFLLPVEPPPETRQKTRPSGHTPPTTRISTHPRTHKLVCRDRSRDPPFSLYPRVRVCLRLLLPFGKQTTKKTATRVDGRSEGIKEGTKGQAKGARGACERERASDHVSEGFVGYDGLPEPFREVVKGTQRERKQGR